MDFDTWWKTDAAPRLQDPLIVKWIGVIEAVAKCAWIQGGNEADLEGRKRMERLFAQFDRPEAVEKTAERLLAEL